MKPAVAYPLSFFSRSPLARIFGCALAVLIAAATLPCAAVAGTPHDDFPPDGSTHCPLPAGSINVDLSNVGTGPYTVTFAGGETAPSGNYTYSWNFGDGSTATGFSLSHVYSDSGVYEVSLLITDPSNPAEDCFSGYSSEVTVGIPSVYPTPDPACADLHVAISRTIENDSQVPFDVLLDGSASTSSAEIVSYLWDFGDGSSASGATVTHTYTEFNAYVAKLTITDGRGCVESDTIGIANWPADAPTATPTPTFTPTASEASTPLPTISATVTPTPTSSAIPSQPPSASPTPSMTDTPAPTSSSIPTQEPTVAATSTPTSTPADAPMPTSTPTVTPTPTAVPDLMIDLSYIDQTEEEEDDAQFPPALLPNDDDDNQDTIPDYQEHPVTNDDDLRQLVTHIGTSETGPFELAVEFETNDRIDAKFWLDPEKQTELVLTPDPSYTGTGERRIVTWNDRQDVPASIWLEGIRKQDGHGLDRFPKFVMSLKNPRAVDFVYARIEDEIAQRQKEADSIVDAEAQNCGYANTVKAIQRRWQGVQGGKVITISLGDSNSQNSYYYPGYGEASKLEQDARNQTLYGTAAWKMDGWYLVRTDVAPKGDRSFTAAGGQRLWSSTLPTSGKPGTGNMIDGYMPLQGGPKLLDGKSLLDTYKGLIAVILIGTNDAKIKGNQTTLKTYKDTLRTFVKDLVRSNIIPILVAPQPLYMGSAPWRGTAEYDRIMEFNEAVIDVACELKVPVVDFSSAMDAVYKLDTGANTIYNSEIKKRFYVNKKGDDGVHLNPRFWGWDRYTDWWRLSRDGQLLHSWIVLNKVARVLKTIGLI